MDQLLIKKIAEIKKTPWTFFVHKMPVTIVTIIGIVIFGLFAFFTLPREIQPEINIPIGAVMTVLPGASPEDTESLLTDPLEKEIGSISGIKSMSSQSGFGMSLIAIEFETSVDIDKAIQDLKDATDRAKTSLPEDATEPNVIRMETNEFSIITFSLMGNRPMVELSKIAEKIEPELEKINGASKVNIMGEQTEEIHVILNQEKLKQYGLDIQTISSLIKFSNTNLPIGITTLDKLNYSIRIDNRYSNIEEIRNIPLFTSGQNQSPILLKDIAKVEKGYPQQNVITKLSVNGKNSLPAVSIQIYKKEGGNILEIVDLLKTKIQDLKDNKTIPDDVEVAVSNDNSLFIKDDLGVLTENGIGTTILIITILFLGLGFRMGLVAGLSVPLTFLMTFAAMSFYGLTINSLSLFAMVIALGIMVDTSVVIMQGIHDLIKKGASSKEAALLAIATYRWPLIAGTMTTIFAFFPMLLVSGIIGEFLRSLPIVISAALFGSLFLGLTIIPAIATRVNSEKERTKTNWLEPLFTRIEKKFENINSSLIAKKSYRITLIIILVTLFISSMALPITGILKTELFSETNQRYFIIRVEAPVGTVVEKTKEIAERIEKRLYEIPEIDNFLTTIGSNQSPAISEGLTINTDQQNSNVANITINLVDKDLRDQTSYEIADKLEEEFKLIKDAKVYINQLKEGPPQDAAITARITGQDPEGLRELTNEIKTIFQETKGTKNVDTSIKPGLNEFKFTLDRDTLTMHGLTTIQVAGAIRNILQGINTATIKLNNEDIDIIVKYDLPKVNNRTNLSLNDIENFGISTPKGYSISLSELGKYDFSQSSDSIEREDQKRITKVTSGVEDGYNSVELTKELQTAIDKFDIPSGYDVSFGGDFESINESFNDLYRSMIVGVILIAFCIILEFNSFRQALIIMLTLPMALIGVFPGLLILGLNLSFPAFLGVVALAGVVVNNAIVLIDRINNNRKDGLEFKKAISEAANARLKPIIMTTVTTIVGIIPLAISNEFWAGLGFSMVFGLAFSTLLTLIAIPTFYYIFEGEKARKTGELII